MRLLWGLTHCLKFRHHYSFFLLTVNFFDIRFLLSEFTQTPHIIMSRTLCRLLLLLFSLINVSFGEKNQTTTHQTSEEWEYMCRDRIGGTLIWNNEKTIAVVYQNQGGSAYSYYYWCFRKSESGRMLPLAVYSTKSDYLHPIEVKISQSGILVTLTGYNKTYYTQEFSFTSQRANVEIWENMKPYYRTSEEWEYVCRNHIGGTLIWNNEKTIAVVYQNQGGSAYSYYYWCFRKSESGRMLPLAVYSTKSDYLHPIEVKISQSGILVTLTDNDKTYYTQEFSFTSKRADIEIWENMKEPVFCRSPQYEDFQF